MTEIPSDKTIAQQIQEAIDSDYKLKQCISCSHYNRISGQCEITGMKMMPYVRGCNGKHFVTNMEMMVSNVRKAYEEEATQCNKIDNYLALSITTANSASCFFTRLHKMIKDLRDKETDKQQKRMLYKDLECVEEMQKGIEYIDKELASLYEIMDEKLEKVDQLYRIYIEPRTNSMFTNRNGSYDGKSADGHLNNSMSFCRLLTKYTKGCIHNQVNDDMVFNMLDNLVNDFPYALTHKDADSFVLKGYR